MTALPESARLRGDLSGLLHETDPHRPLDSLETVVVLTHLNKYSLPTDQLVGDRPETIEGWVAWVAKHSFGS